jgi:tetratricopeptide (TPR) repeat protein
VALDRENGDFNFALGRILARHRRHTEAVDYLSTAFDVFPKRSEVANTYGLALEKSGNTPKALEIFRHAASVTPNDADILANLGRTLVQMSLYDEASGILNRALALDTENPVAHAAMADLCLRQGHRKEALMHLREALSEDPKNEGARKMFESLWKGSLGEIQEE